MKLLSLRIRNFKGVREFALDTQGRSVSVYGSNAAGKTTLADAWHWLLFGKDSLNRADFEILPLGPDGKRLIEIAEAEVEAVISTDKEGLGLDPINLKRIYSEKWVKRRGAASPELAGHTTVYLVDGVPYKERDFKGRIASLMDESRFRLLANPRFFNDYLPWQERRRILLEVCGDISDSDVMASDKALSELPGILGKHTADDHREVCLGRRRDLNKRLAEIPTRIDEAQRGLPAIPEPESLAGDPRDLRARRESLLEKKATMAAGGGIAEKTKELREIEGQMMGLENEHAARRASERSKLARQLADEQDWNERDRRGMTVARAAIDDADRLMADLKARLGELGREWRRVSGAVFDHQDVTICYACGNPLRPEQVEKAHEAALSQWNVDRAQSLELMERAAKALKAQLAVMDTDRGKLLAGVDQVERAIAARGAAINDLQAQLSAQDQAAQARPASTDYLALGKRKRQIEDTITVLQAGGPADTGEIDRQVARLDTQISDTEAALAQVRQRDQGLKRIQELHDQKRTLAAELEQIEKALYLMDAFIRAKVGMLTDKINGRFRLARFKLFDQLVNGGLEPCCETTYQGIPWSGGLNNSAQIAVGLDIISTLSEFYGATAPIWIDNSEAITTIPATAGQQIRLYVSGKDRALVVTP